MATHKSALKAHRQSLKRRARNRQLRSRLRTALKDVRRALEAGDATGAQKALPSTLSVIDRMVTKGIIHRNTAGRYKSRLVNQVRKASAAA